jgi:pilin/secretion family protein with methylation motif
MTQFHILRRRRRGHTLMELIVAMAASTFLLAGMGSVMFIGRQIAYTPSDASRRAQAADIVGQICDELRYATLVIQQTPQILEFVVADRNADGTAEKIRYEWSGVAGAPLRKTINGGTAVDVLSSVNAFTITLQQSQKTTTLTTTTDSAEAALLANTAVSNVTYRDISATNYMAQAINPAAFSSVPANAVGWNATKIDFYGKQNGVVGDTLLVQIRQTGDPYDQPTNNVLGQVALAESAIVDGWNTVTFATPIRGLAFNRKYDLVFAQAGGGGGMAAKIGYNDSLETGINDSTDAGASWQYMTTRQMWGRVYGTYSTPGTTYNVTRNYVPTVRIALQSGSQGYARVDASAPLRNLPELVTSYWRTDFDRSPTATNGNGDTAADWAVTGGGSFDTSRLANGVWNATGGIETRPLADFTTTTTVEVRCRNTTVGGNGAVCLIYADRQGGQYAPILVYLQRQSDGTQTLTLSGKTSDSLTSSLFSRTKLSGNFVRYKLTILPNNNFVNLQINGEDQGTYTYPTYVPSGTTDRFLTLTTDSSASEFDYVDVRVN